MPEIEQDLAFSLGAVDASVTAFASAMRCIPGDDSRVCVVEQLIQAVVTRAYDPSEHCMCG